MSKLTVAKVAQFKGHRDGVYALDVRNSNQFYSGGADGMLVEWNWPLSTDGKLIAQLPEAIYSLRVDGDRNRIYAGTSSGALYVFDLMNLKEIAKVKNHDKGVFDIQILDDKVYAFGGDGNLSEFDLQLKTIRTIDLSIKSLRNAILVDREFWIACSDHNIKRFDPISWKLMNSYEGHRNSVFTLAMGRNLYSAGRDAAIKKWSDNGEFSQLKSVAAHMYTVNALHIHESGDFILSASMDKSIRIWDTDLILLREVNQQKDEAHSNCVNKVMWLDAHHFISCGDDRAVMIFSVEF
jgi:WD40 repeat protein